jgi:hypothetical protein
MQHVQGYTGSHWTPPSGDSKQNNDVLFTHFDGHFGGHCNAAVLYRMHRPMEEVQGFHISH